MGVLFDSHAHTSCLSYCCDPEITPETYRQALREHPELAGVAITNHGFATYFPLETAWAAEFMQNPGMFDRHLDFGNRRLEKHLQEVEPLLAEGIYTGFEVEMMADGRLTLDPAFRGRLDVLIGSVHFMPGFEPGSAGLQEAWWAHTERLLDSGIDVLGHPFRWLARNGRVEVTEEMIRRLVRMAKAAGVALELNSHMRIPGDVLLLRECMEAGVPVTLATDSHSLAEIADLGYPLSVVGAAGLTLAQLPVWLPRRFRLRGAAAEPAGGCCSSGYVDGGT